MSDAQLAQALNAYQECEATYLYPKNDDERDRAAIAGFWNARNIIPALLAEVEQLQARNAVLVEVMREVIKLMSENGRQLPKPTSGQQRILQFAARATRVLRATQARPDAEVAYEIVERGTGRIIMSVTPRMLNSLRAAGWIEHAPGGNAQEWTYRVTEAGIAAANLPFEK